MKTGIKILIVLVGVFLFSCNVDKISKAGSPQEISESIKEWESLKFGAFVHFNDNTSLENELSKNTDAAIFNPVNLNFETMMQAFKKAGIKYAVLTTRHTSGFCLWDSKVSEFDVANSLYKKDVVKLFVDACLKYNIKPCFYYCLWGKDWKPWEWNPVIKKEVDASSSKEIIKTQLTELAENYGSIFEFWLDMKCWTDTTFTSQEIYDLLKNKNPGTIVHFNQHVQDGTTIKYFPTDIINGEERTPPEKGHNPFRQVGTNNYYLPFEYEITSQRCDNRTIGHGLMKGSVWFTYSDSRFYPVDSLFNYIKQNYKRGGSNILLSTAPDKTGLYRQADCDSIIKLGGMIRKYQYE
jgi:alpha-L-fucosidase